MTQELLQKLAEKIKEKIKDDFKEVHLSQKLMNTISVTPTSTGFLIDIPAEVYDLNKYKKEGVIVYTGNGSYAEEVDVQGGFSGKHKEYIERAILESIREWLVENELRARIVEL